MVPSSGHVDAKYACQRDVKIWAAAIVEGGTDILLVLGKKGSWVVDEKGTG